jgi:hypothetical protein
MKKWMELGRLVLALIVTATLSVTCAPQAFAGSTVTKSCTATNHATGSLLLYGGESATFSVSGTYVGTAKVQKSQNGSDWEDVGVSTRNTSSYSEVLYVDSAQGRRVFYRVLCSAIYSGTLAASLADIDDTSKVFYNNKGSAILTLKDDTVVVGGSGLTGASVETGGIVTAKLGDGAVTSVKINDAAVITAKISDGAVTSIKVNDAAVITAKISDGAVTSIKVNDAAIITAKISDGAVTSVKINDEAVITAKLPNGAVTENKIASDAVVTSKIKNSSVITAKLYLDLPETYAACITTAKLLGRCGSAVAADGTCSCY